MTHTAPDRHRHREAGMVAGIELPLAIVTLLVPVTFGLLAASQWPERQTVARAAAHEAALRAATANDAGAATSSATRAVTETARNHGLAGDDLTVTLDGTLERGATITARVTVRMPALAVPGLGAFEPWTWTATHAERVDDYRSLP